MVLPSPLSYIGVLCYIAVRPSAISCPNLYTTIVSCKRRSCNPQRRFLSQDKSKVVPLRSMEACRGVGPLILTLGTNFRWVISFTLRPLYPRGKTSRKLSNRNLGDSQNRYGRFWGSENPIVGLSKLRTDE